LFNEETGDTEVDEEMADEPENSEVEPVEQD